MLWELKTYVQPRILLLLGIVVAVALPLYIAALFAAMCIMLDLAQEILIMRDV